MQRLAFAIALLAYFLGPSSAFAQNFLSIGNGGGCGSTCTHSDMSLAVVDAAAMGFDTICVSNNPAVLPTGVAHRIDTLAAGQDLRIFGANATCSSPLAAAASPSTYPQIDLDRNFLVIVGSGQDIELRRLRYRDGGTAFFTSEVALVLNGGTLTANDVWFEQSNSTAVFASGGDFDMIGNSRLQDGSNFSALRVSSGGTATLRDTSQIRNNEASLGAGVLLQGGELVLRNSAAITHNTADTRGGGIFADGAGSSVDAWGNPALMASISISQNEAGIEGGGIFASSSGTIDLEGVAMTSNNAGTRGGAMFIQSATADFDRVQPGFSEAPTGSAVYALNARLFFDDITVSSNRDGVAMFLDDSDLDIDDGELTFNQQGAVQAVNNSSLILVAVDVRGNSGAPAIDLEDSALLVDDKINCGLDLDRPCNNFTSNNAGAIRADNSAVTATRTLFRGNDAPSTTEGSALTLTNDSVGNVDNSVFRQNELGRAAALADDSEMNFTQATFYDNTSRGTWYVSSNGDIKNSIFQDDSLTSFVSTSTVSLDCVRTPPFNVTVSAFSTTDVTSAPVTFVGPPSDLRLDPSDTVAVNACGPLFGTRPDMLLYPVVNDYDMGAYELTEVLVPLFRSGNWGDPDGVLEATCDGTTVTLDSSSQCCGTITCPLYATVGVSCTGDPGGDAYVIDLTSSAGFLGRSPISGSVSGEVTATSGEFVDCEYTLQED